MLQEYHHDGRPPLRAPTTLIGHILLTAPERAKLGHSVLRGTVVGKTSEWSAAATETTCSPTQHGAFQPLLLAYHCHKQKSMRTTRH
jgi:hypothetical protein